MSEKEQRPIGEVINEYAELRDFLSVERKKFKELEDKIKGDLENLEVLLLEKQRELGLTSLSNDRYTAFQTQKKYVRVGNWDTFINFVAESKNFQMLEKRCAKLACLEQFEEGIVPNEVGLDYYTEIEVQVRKK
jgi:hypothetical protein